MTIEDKDARVVIVGAGVMGISMAYTLLKNGYTDIHIFDEKDYEIQGYQYSKGCDSPSSDLNKVFRTAYGTAKHYQYMAEKSQAQFINWNKQIKNENWEDGDPIYLNTGWLNISDSCNALQKTTDEEFIDIASSDALRKVQNLGLDKSAIDPFHVHSKGQLTNGFLDTKGGMTLADKSMRWVLHLLNRLNKKGHLRFHWGKSVSILTQGTGAQKEAIGVRTEDGETYLSMLTIVAAGPWVSQLVPEANEKVEATGGTVALFKVTDKGLLDRLTCKKSPTWIFNMSQKHTGSVYGLPITDGYLKIGFRGVKFTNPKLNVNSKVKTKWSDESESNVPLFGLILIKNFVRKYIPELKKITETRLCWYADTSDNEYLIDYCPHYKNNSLFIIGGDSGHAFKMLGVIGDYALDILLNRGDPKLAYIWSWQRERPNMNSLNMGTYNPNTLDNVKMATRKDWWINEQCKL